MDCGLRWPLAPRASRCRRSAAERNTRPLSWGAKLSGSPAAPMQCCRPLSKTSTSTVASACPATSTENDGLLPVDALVDALVEPPSPSDCSPSSLQLGEGARRAAPRKAGARPPPGLLGCSNQRLAHQGNTCSTQTSAGRPGGPPLPARPSSPTRTTDLNDAGYSQLRAGVHGCSLRANVKGTPGSPAPAGPPSAPGAPPAAAAAAATSSTSSSSSSPSEPPWRSAALSRAAVPAGIGRSGEGSTRHANCTEPSGSTTKRVSVWRVTRRSCCVLPVWNGPTSTPPTSSRSYRYFVRGLAHAPT
mmetsp:Transcript_60264/g.171174  ORF Transcript_60264/g.171174 Transcript_60264/m.171174 type:complete len:303 (+) Transcript_60264:317-1225(+)